MNGVQINLVCCTQVILQDLKSPQCRQKHVALSYAMAIKSAAQHADTPDWPTINHAIISKWSQAGLERIKKRAWGILQGKVRP